VKLRRQLALVSVMVLVLPWALGQYLQVFDQLLREGQTRALNATALAVAARLGADTALLDEARLSRRATLAAEHELYAHPLPAPPAIDGRAQDWSAYGYTPRQFSRPAPHGATTAQPAALQLTAGFYRDELFLLAQVNDSERHYHRPGSDHLARGDHLIVANQQRGKGSRYYAIRASAPGRVQAVYRDAHGDIRPDYRIRGRWRETNSGYQVELRMPRAMAEQHFAVSAVNKNGASVSALGTAGPWAERAGGPDAGVLPGTKGRLIWQSAALSDALTVFARPGMRLQVTDKQGWQIAQAGQLEPVSAPRNRALQWLLDFAGKRHTLPPWQPSHNGRQQQPPTSRALAGNSDNRWYRAGSDDIASVAVPLYLGWPSAGAVESQLAGAVVLEQRLQPWQGLGSTAIGRLAWVSAVSGALLILALIGYASWLSARIRTLARAATNAQQQPLRQVLEHWPRYRLNDELADLSGQYRELLTQVQGHTDYLKSLTGKLSHELRTPLAIVRSSLDNLGDRLTEPQAAQAVYVQRARLGCERLSAIITAMSEADRVEASIRASEPETVDLAQLVQDMTEAYRSAYPGHTFRCHIARAAPEAYITAAAPELLVQLLDKLVDNATDFSPPDEPIELHLQICHHEPLGKGYRLSVTNTGPSLPEALEGQLFNSLTSARSAQPSPPTGAPGQVHLGLGLHIVELIARSHQGRAQAQNLGQGVCFSVEFPAQSAAIRAQRL
jgi:dedicated sortase system histidine kinase